MDAFNKINNAGGNATIMVCSQGDHGFFKAGTTHNADVMENCFAAIDTFVKKPEVMRRASIDSEEVDSADAEKLEGKIRETDKNYRNYQKLLKDFHKDDKVAQEAWPEKGIPRKNEYLRKIRDAHQEKMEFLLSKKCREEHPSVTSHKTLIAAINTKLEQG